MEQKKSAHPRHSPDGFRVFPLRSRIEDKGLSFVGKTVTVAGWTRTMREQVRCG